MSAEIKAGAERNAQSAKPLIPAFVAVALQLVDASRSSVRWGVRRSRRLPMSGKTSWAYALTYCSNRSW